jgi:hypothetical protein
VSGVRRRSFDKRIPMPAAELTRAVEPGLHCELFEGTWNSLPDFDALEPVKTSIAPVAGLTTIPAGKEYFGLRMRGLVYVAADGLYEVTLNSDDGARCRINGKLVVDLDGLHVDESRTGSIALARGPHWIEIEYFNKTGDAALGLRIGLVGQPGEPVDPRNLLHEVD